MSKTRTKRIALVTGANRGLGLEISRQLALRDIKVIMGARNQEKGSKASVELARQGLDVDFQLLDVTDEESVVAAICTIKNRAVIPW